MVISPSPVYRAIHAYDGFMKFPELQVSIPGAVICQGSYVVEISQRRNT
jgi:hypothetical protein